MPKKETTVTGLWKNIKFVCGNKIPDPDNAGTFKTCHSSFEQTMISGKPCMHCPVCGFTATYYDAEKAVQMISDEILDAIAEDYEVNFKNEKFKVIDKKQRITTVFRVIKDVNKKMTIEVYREG